MTNDRRAILLIHCPDQMGLVAAITDFLQKNNGNVITLDQHVDRISNEFFMRVEWELNGFSIPAHKIDEFFGTLIGHKHRMKWRLFFSDEKPKMAIFVSKMSHCLYDILQRYVSGEWEVDIPLIVSNHEGLKYVANRFEIDFHHIPVDSKNKEAAEAAETALLLEHKVDFVVLARYMQILSPAIISRFPSRIINIHHSFLPAFKGAKPYHSAFERGVKIIGATSHYVTSDLDEGPIIAQDVVRVTHKDTVEDMVRKGKDLEKVVLAQAIRLEIEHKILVYGNKTIVFD